MDHVHQPRAPRFTQSAAHTCPVDGAFDGHRAQPGGRDRGQAASEGPHGRPGRAHDEDLLKAHVPLRIRARHWTSQLLELTLSEVRVENLLARCLQSCNSKTHLDWDAAVLASPCSRCDTPGPGPGPEPGTSGQPRTRRSQGRSEPGPVQYGGLAAPSTLKDTSKLLVPTATYQAFIILNVHGD